MLPVAPVSPKDKKVHHEMTASRKRAAVAAFVMFAIGTLTWRTRSSTDLSANAVDSAAAVRLIADFFAAAVVALAAVRSPSSGSAAAPPREACPDSRPPRVGPIWLYAGYILIVAIGSLMAVRPELVVFRALDLTVCLVVSVALGIWLTFDEITSLAYRVVTTLSGAIIASALAFPSQGISAAKAGGVIPIRLQGVYPTLSYNSVGVVGVIVYSLALAGAARRRNLGVSLGVALVILSQYRTGYVALPCIYAVYLLASGGAKRLAIAILAPCVYILSRSAAFQNAWIRGEQASHSTTTLSGRTVWWDYAIDVASRSPVVGTGLTSGSRYEVLSERLGNTEASTIHGTWIEVYLGTGILGLLTLGSFVTWAVWASVKWRSQSLVPLLLTTALLVRSLTGSSIELASWLLALWLSTLLAGYRTLTPTLVGCRQTDTGSTAEERGEGPDLDIGLYAIHRKDPGCPAGPIL